ncbi:MAG TPA: molybdopterin-guanine dinucleotide biosynthesis protein B [Gemmatimonadaceae bacterium]|nr:molybdopterin-guanine dinucleotide biosynthesis protein B [Gemmatimonadaceae bacterium]
MRQPPLVAIIGRKNSGKTTLLVRLAAELHRRGHRVMTIKHGTHTFNIDPATTDTYRHFHEGNAERVAMVAPDKFALVMRWDDELTAEEVARRHMGDADVVLCEGFKASALPKIEVHRVAAHPRPLFAATSEQAAYYRAIVTDDAALQVPVPVVRLDHEGWLDALVGIVIRDVMEA